MSLSQVATDDAGPILFTMDSNTSNTQSSPKTPHSPPPLPKRNVRRASRFLDALLDSSAPTTATTPTTVTASAISTVSAISTSATSATSATAAASADANKTLKPSPKMTTTAHEVYLSSEEDASSLGDISDYDDAEDYDYDSDSVEYIGAPVVLQIAAASTTSSSSPNMPASAPPNPTAAPPFPTTENAALPTLPAQRHSHEDKARLVSVVYAGKPSLVDLAVERAARHHRSLNDRAISPSPSTSSASMVSSARSNRSNSTASRPSTSAGTAPSTAFSSVNTSPQRLHHKRNSSGSMVASFRARKAMTTIADSPATMSKDTDMPIPKPTRAHTTTSSMMPPRNTALAAATAAAASPLSSPRTPTFGHGNLLRGVTRTLTLSRRSSRLLNKERDATCAVPQSPSTYTSAAPPLPGQLPGVAAPAAPTAPTPSDASMLRRKSLALSAVALGFGHGNHDKSVPPIPPAPSEHLFTTSISPALRRASTNSSALLSPVPSHKVLIKKNGNGAASPSTSFFSRRRSSRML